MTAGERYENHRDYVKKHYPNARLTVDDYGMYQIKSGDEKISAKRAKAELAWSNAFLFVYDS